MQLSATALAPVNSYGVLADFIRLITRRRSSSIIHTPSQRPRATQHRIAHCISRAPESHSRPTICDLSARPRGLSLGGDRRGSNPRPSLEPQSDDICFQLLPEVAESAYLSRSLCSRLPDVSGCSALGGVRSGVKWHQPLPLSPSGLIASRSTRLHAGLKLIGRGSGRPYSGAAHGSSPRSGARPPTRRLASRAPPHGPQPQRPLLCGRRFPGPSSPPYHAASPLGALVGRNRLSLRRIPCPLSWRRSQRHRRSRASLAPCHGAPRQGRCSPIRRRLWP